VLANYVLSHLLSVATAITSTLMVIRLLSTSRAPQSLLAWVLALIFLPLAAIPLYFLIGTRKFPRVAKREALWVAARSGATRAGPVARVLEAIDAPPVREGNQLELLGSGERAYARLMELIGEAKRTIDLEFFILAKDSVGLSVVEALAARAKSGVRVRVVLDAVGSGAVKRRAAKVLEAAGGSLRTFLPLWQAPLRGRTNLRCHRKLAVFDGEHVLLGGMNIAEEYMGPTPKPGRWRDIAAVASGPVAMDATALFESDWAFCGGEPEPRDGRSGPGEAVGHATLELVPSGPDLVHDTFYNALITAIFSASQRVAIVTPYYVPDDVVQRALVLAARRGLRVQLIMPAHSNHAMTDFARRGLLRQLRTAGVELHFYPHGMVHAKAMVVDDTFAYIGSPNIDMRSFFLNYENALCVYSAPEISLVRDWVDTLKAECNQELPHSARELWLFEQVARMLAPEL
jgi:cardiolipin synthase